MTSFTHLLRFFLTVPALGFYIPAGLTSYHGKWVHLVEQNCQSLRAASVAAPVTNMSVRRLSVGAESVFCVGAPVAVWRLPPAELCGRLGLVA